MPNIAIDCPYCQKGITSTFYLKHIFSSHFDAMFNPNDNRGKQNRFLIESSTKPKPIAFYLPNSQANHCCLHCMVSCVKLSSALKHFDHEECKVGHMEKLKELKQQIQSVAPQEEPKKESVSSNLIDNDVFLSALYQYQRTIDALEAENKQIQNTMSHLLEKGIDIHEWDDEDIPMEQDDDDPSRILDIVGRAMNWKITRTELETAFLKTKPALINLIASRKPKKVKASTA